jgi:23S rRNA (uracil1939-C5)-methyltransferase
VQVNVDVATKIYAAAEEWLAPAADAVVLDVFGGVGGMGLALAPRVRRVLGVEASAASVACATANARRAHLRHVEYVVGDASAIVTIAAEHGLQAGAGAGLLAVVNPPRRGLDEGERSALVALAPRALLYLSCNPTTLARDLAALHARGFAVRRLRPFDMMPQTPHVEVLALLERTTDVLDGAGAAKLSDAGARPNAPRRRDHHAVSRSPFRKRCAIRICCTSDEPS